MNAADRITWSTALAVVGVAAVAAVVSYEPAYDLVRAHGEAGLTVRLVALTVKGLIYASSMVMLDAALPGRQDVDVEFVTLRVGHAAPQETLEFAGGSGFEPATAGLFYFRRRLVEVVYHQVKMHAVLA
jgi:hypothetical protein